MVIVKQKNRWQLMRLRHFHFLILLLFWISPKLVNAEQLTIAVASNFQPTLVALKKSFESTNQHHLNIVIGSTGKLYAQIINGAPYDVFMSADKQTPLLLEKNHLAIQNSRMTYAIGRLVLWSADPQLVVSQSSSLLNNKIHKIAMANPKLAPYGEAAEDYLSLMHAEEFNQLYEKLIKTENVSQAFHMVMSGSAEVGFVALSQICNPQKNWGGSYWLIPQSYHQPIEQQAIQLTQNLAAEQFMQFLTSPSAIKIIESFGYQVLNEQTDLTDVNHSTSNKENQSCYPI